MATHTFNRSHSTFNVVVDTKAKSVTVTRDNKESVSFKVGDTAVYDSWNLIYTGAITNITDKTVTIHPRGYQSARRLKLDTFAFYNYDYDAERIATENAETSYYI